MNRPLKLLCVDQFGHTGGAQKSLLDLLSGFSRQGWEPCVAAPGESPLSENIRERGFESHSVDCGEYTSTRKTWTEHAKYAAKMPEITRILENIVRLNNINLLYVNGSRLLPPSAWVARRVGIPIVFHLHNRLMQSSAISLTGHCLEWTGAHLLACCRYAAAPFSKYVKPHRLSIVYNGVAEIKSASKWQPGEPVRRIGVIGRIEPEKGQLEFVQAAALLARNHPECRFSVIGRPMFSTADYQGKVIDASQGLPIEFLDWKSNLEELYSSLDMLVVPSNQMEATTRVILEAYSAGIPVVAFPSGGIPEILHDNETGFLAESCTAEALAYRIVSVLKKETAELAQVVRQAKQAWTKNFTLETYRENVCRAISRAVFMSAEA